MNAIFGRSYAFGRHDRVSISGVHYRPLEKERDRHILQLVSNNVLEEHFAVVTDEEMRSHDDNKNLRHEPGYFLSPDVQLMLRHDDSDLSSLSDEELRTVFWKKEWCDCFHQARRNPNYAIKVNLTKDALRTFIKLEMEKVNRWYIDRFHEPRPLGRPIVVKEQLVPGEQVKKQRKPFDYPSHSTLANWLRQYREGEERLDAFVPRYANCGNRQQIAADVHAILEACAYQYAALNRPSKKQIVEMVEIELDKISRPMVSRTTVHRYIGKLDPMYVQIGRYGEDRAMRKYTPVGMGLDVERPLERVEIDDWDVDLHVLLENTETWKSLSTVQRAEIKKVRCTLTVAIDCRTRCIVGFNVSDGPPSTATSKAALHKVMIDKQGLCDLFQTDSPWHMHGRPEYVASDGGPAFRDEFAEAVRQSISNRRRPDQDPRKRGTIEAFFKTFKMVCRNFAGQAFSNVVELGEYPGHEWASATFEQFVEAAVVFIVDKYHHEPHRGLENRTPFEVWEELAAKGLAKAPDSIQLKLAFGFRHKVPVRLDKHGLLFLGNSYQSPALSSLMAKVGEGATLRIIVDPEDLGGILVIVPAQQREWLASRFGAEMRGHVLEVPNFGGAMAGISLAIYLEENAGERDLVRKENLKGRAIRLSANARLFRLGRDSMKAADIPTHLLTQALFDKAVHAFKNTAQAAMEKPIYSEKPMSTGKAGTGKIVSTAPKTRSVKDNSSPSSKARPVDDVDDDDDSINLFGDEE